jgi:hypothetical protein
MSLPTARRRLSDDGHRRALGGPERRGHVKRRYVQRWGFWPPLLTKFLKKKDDAKGGGAGV